MKKRSNALIISISLIALLGIFNGCSSSDYDAMKEQDLTGVNGDYRESDLDMAREARFGNGSVPMAEGEGIFRDINFGYDSSKLDDAARQNIEYNVQILEQNPGVKVQLEGHCDERGTNEYNLALGDMRSRSVRDLLISYGIGRNRIQTISYGEELPLNSRSNESAWSQNRRVHFSGFTRR